MQFTTRKRSNLFPGRGYRQVSEAALGSFEELVLEYMPEEAGPSVARLRQVTNMIEASCRFAKLFLD